jgi:hypothetical protein
MTADAFDRLLYTDCLPGTGRGAGSGFQVQSQSPGVDAGQSALAVRWLLYEVQVAWLSEKRPVAEFPMGLAHASDEGYGTAQSCYLGKTAAGGRDGNHLTDSLLARDGDLYGAVRPAQLWRSPLWRDSPFPGKECAPLDAAELEAGPLTSEAVAEWARARPGRATVLARLLTLLEDPDGRRAVIVSDSPDEAMTWIAAATLLLPSRHALKASFKVFSSIPLRAEHRIVAAPAALFPQLAPGRGGSVFVLDARTGTADEEPVSERAAFFTAKLAGDGDAYDVLDAVELAEVLGDPRQHLGGRDAMLTAWALTRPDEALPEPAALFRWISGTRQELLAEHGPQVAALILDSAPTADALRWLDRAVAGKRLDIDPVGVRVRLLSAELAQIRNGLGLAPVQDVLPPAPLDPGAARDAESELSSAILLGSNQQADRLLGLARRHGITPELAAPLHQRLRDFAGGWIDHPAGYQPDNWALREQVLDCAHDELRHRAATSGIQSVAGNIRRLNQYFASRADLSDPLDCHIQASLIAADRAGRVARLRELLGSIVRGTESPAAAATGLQRALIDWRAVTGEVAVIVLTELPDSFDVEYAISARAAEELTLMSKKPTRALLDLLDRLDRRGKAPAADGLTRILEEDKRVRAFIDRAGADRLRTDAAYLEDTVAALRKADPAVVEARLDEVLAACLHASHPYLGAVVLAELKSPLPRLLVQRWGQTLGTRDLISDGRWCVTCLDFEDLPGKRQDQLAAVVRDFAATLSPAEFDAWYDEVARQVGPGQRDLWESVFPQDAPRARRTLWRTRDSGRS